MPYKTSNLCADKAKVKTIITTNRTTLCGHIDKKVNARGNSVLFNSKTSKSWEVAIKEKTLKNSFHHQKRTAYH